MAERHPHFDHMQRALDWALVLDPEASDAVRIAAVTHDAERPIPTPTRRGTPRCRGRTPSTTAGTRSAARSSSANGCASRSRGGADRGGRAARQRARGGRLARGRHRAGGRLALLPRDDGLDPAEWIQSGRCSRRAPRARRATRSSASARSSCRRARRAAPLLEAALQRLAAVSAPGGGAGRDRARARGPDPGAGAGALPAHAGLPRPSKLRGALLPDPAGNPRRRRHALWAPATRRASAT